MRVTFYDRSPGTGLDQWLLKISWAVGCWFQWMLGLVDDYVGVSSFDEALAWLTSRPGTLTSVQYWGHGAPGCIIVSGKAIASHKFLPLKSKLAPSSVVWFRTCSTFQGPFGQDFAEEVGDMLDCVVAGHTRIIGLWQGGLHTRAPRTVPSWPLHEREYLGRLPAHLFPVGNNTLFCLATRIPNGW